MKDFFELREEFAQINEANMSGGIKAELNKLQQWWNENHVSMGLYDPKDKAKKKSQLFPILYPPFDVIRSGGILVLGYNPGGAGGRVDEFIAAVEKSKKEHNGIPPVYDKQKGGWYHVYAYDDIKGGVTTGKKGQYSKRYTKKGPKGEEKLSKFNTKHWHGKGNRPASLSELGAFQFNASLNTMFDDLGLSSYRKKMMHSNWIPFNSVNDSFKSKGAVERVSTPWVEALIKTSKPKLIVCPTKIFKLFQKHMGMKVDKKSLQIRKESNSHLFYASGVLPNGVNVVSFSHWSSSQVGGPKNPNWNEKNIKAIKKDIQRMLKN